MRVAQILAPVVGLFAVANAWGETAVWTTVVETDYTTYCPAATTFAWQNVTYTATTATTLTITSILPLHYHLLYTSPTTFTSYPTSIPLSTGSVGTTSYTYSNGSSTVITYTPSVSTGISGTVPITTPVVPTNTPVGPTSSGPVVIPTAAADKIGPVGALLAAGIAALAL
ncbi:hypothetical protein ABKA04_001325 [Annulohypoxylon sp. FPYF3050]